MKLNESLFWLSNRILHFRFSMSNKTTPDIQAILQKEDFQSNKFRKVFHHVMKYANKYSFINGNPVRKRSIFISINKENIFF